MFSQSQFSTLHPAPLVESDAPAPHLQYGPLSSDCFLSDEHFLEQQTYGHVYYDSPPEQQWAPDVSTMSAPLPFHVDYLRTAAIFGHQDSVQSTASHHGMSLAPYYFSYAEFAAPAHLISPVVLGQVNQGSPLYSTSSQPYLPPFGDDANATPTLHGSGGTPATAAMASFPLEASQIHPLPPQFTNSVTEEPPNVPSRSSGDLKRCEWKNSQGDVCGTLVSRHCQEHLASAHGIFKMSSVTPVKCGACDEKMKRKSFLRHFRERHLGFRRQ